MSLRFRKAVGLGKLARLNVSKSGLSLSLGVPGMRVNVPVVGTHRRKPNATLGIPGTGLSYNFRLANDNSRRGESHPQGANQGGDHPQFGPGQYKEFKAYYLQKVTEFKQELGALEAQAWDAVREEGLTEMPATTRLKIDANRADFAKFEAWVNSLPDKAPEPQPQPSQSSIWSGWPIVVIVLAIILSIGIGFARAETQTPIYDSSGRYQGSVFNYGKTQTYTDRNGHFVGSSVQNNNGTTSFYNRNGNFSGSAGSSIDRAFNFNKR